MKRLFTSLILVFMVVGSTAQKLDFDELSSIPEFELFTAYECEQSDCSIIISGVSQVIAVSFDNGGYSLFDNFPDGKPVLFQELGTDFIVGYNLTNLYSVKRSGLLELNLGLSNDESIGSIFPAEDDFSFYVSTTRGIYKSTDSGNSFVLQSEWSEPTQSSLPITVSIWTYSVKHLTNSNLFYFEVRDNAANILQEYPLSFSPRSLVIRDNFAYMTAFGDKSIYRLDLVSGDVSNLEFPFLGDRNNLFLFEDEILIYRIAHLGNTEKINLRASETSSRFL